MSLILKWLPIACLAVGVFLLVFGIKGDRERCKKTAIALVVAGGLFYLILT